MGRRRGYQREVRHQRHAYLPGLEGRRQGRRAGRRIKGKARRVGREVCLMSHMHVSRARASPPICRFRDRTEKRPLSYKHDVLKSLGREGIGQYVEFAVAPTRDQYKHELCKKKKK